MPLQARLHVRNRTSRLTNLKNLMQSVLQSMPQVTTSSCRSLCVLRDCAVPSLLQSPLCHYRLKNLMILVGVWGGPTPPVTG